DLVPPVASATATYAATITSVTGIRAGDRRKRIRTATTAATASSVTTQPCQSAGRQPRPTRRRWNHRRDLINPPHLRRRPVALPEACNSTSTAATPMPTTTTSRGYRGDVSLSG